MNKLPFKINELQFDNKNKNTSFFPLPLRCIIVGASGCGKTTLLYHLITKSWGISFLNLYIYGATYIFKIERSLQRAFGFRR
jgi:GTPase SAR1 family protein